MVFVRATLGLGEVMSNESTGLMYFALHHKCGNTYFKKALTEFSELSVDPAFEFATLLPGRAATASFHCPTLVRLRNFSLRHLLLLPQPAKVVACKRDPRGLIVSCTDYHRRGSEAWTTAPDQRYGGMSYQALLNSAPSEEDAFILSMKHVAGRILNNLRTLLDAPDIYFVALEDLSWDESGKTYASLCDFLDLSSRNRELLISSLAKHSLWANLKRHGKLPKHSTGGVSDSSSQRLQGRALREYRLLFGDLHSELGY